MKIILETERLILREFIEDDASCFYEMNLDKEVLKFTGDIPFKSISEARKFIINYNHYNNYNYGRWAVCLKPSNQFIGFCGLRRNEELNDTDLGFRIAKKYWNYGYATESSNAVLQYGLDKLNLKSIVARVYIKNESSIKVLKKCGMTYVKDVIYDEKPAVLYIKTNDNS